MSDKLITSAKVLCVIVGISFSLMLVALFLSVAWMALTSAGLGGEHKPNAFRVYRYSAGGLWCA